MQVCSFNDATLHVFQQVDFGTLRAETLYDCAFRWRRWHREKRDSLPDR
jgi:hypothetical protein